MDKQSWVEWSSSNPSGYTSSQLKTRRDKERASWRMFWVCIPREVGTPLWVLVMARTWFYARQLLCTAGLFEQEWTGEGMTEIDAETPRTVVNKGDLLVEADPEGAPQVFQAPRAFSFSARTHRRSEEQCDPWFWEPVAFEGGRAYPRVAGRVQENRQEADHTEAGGPPQDQGGGNQKRSKVKSRDRDRKKSVRGSRRGRVR